jgi:ABC-type microcin C transport system permease subunit YejB
VIIVGLRDPRLPVRDPAAGAVRGRLYWQIFPLRGLTSDNWEELPVLGKIVDYFWHIALPVLA